MTIIDIIFTAIIAIMTLRCATRGFISELLSMAALIAGVLAALFFYRAGGAFVREQFMPDAKAVPEIIAFIALFIIAFALIKILEIMVKHIIEGVKLGSLDRLLGFIFGMAEGLIVVCLILFLISIQPFFDPATILEKSIFAKVLVPLFMEIKGTAAESVVWLKGGNNV